MTPMAYHILIGISTAGYRIIVVISGNNVVSHNSFKKLAFKKSITRFKYILIKQYDYEMTMK